MSETTMTTEIAGALARSTARGWTTVPVHRPNPETGACSCGRSDCAKPGKHPDHRFWPDGSANPAHFVGRNLGVKLGPESANLADVDLDCGEAIAAGRTLLPPTGATFGRGGQVAHALYTVSDRAARYAKLQDPVLSGSGATIAELRWPEWDEDERRFKSMQTVLPPSLHASGTTVEWVSEGDPAVVPGADLCAAVRHVGAAVLIARYARPKERHALVLLIANLLARAGWEDDRIVTFAAAVFDARNDPDKAAKVRNGEGAGAAADARRRLAANKPMTGLPALREMLDPALDARAADAVVMKVKEWLGVPDRPDSVAPSVGPSPTGPRAAYAPIPPYVPFPTDCLPRPWDAFVREGAAALKCDEGLVALPLLAVLAGTIGNTRRVHLGAEWFEPAVFWTCVVAESGGRKSPAAELSVEGVKARQKRLVSEYRAATRDYRSQLAEHKARTRARGASADPPGDEPERPVMGRVLVGDITIEKLAGLLDDNRRGLLVYRDELAGWVGSFTKYKGKGGGSDEPNWLSVHRGDAIVYDRKTGDKTSVFVPHAAVSVCGGIQPGVLKRLASRDLFDSGLVARLIFAMPPRAPKVWSDERVSDATRAATAASLEALYALAAEEDEEGDPRPVVVPLGAEARARLKGFVNAWGRRQFEAEGARAAALAKLEAVPGRFALVRYCARGGTGPIPAEDLEAGIRLAEWCARETERVYALLEESVGDGDVRKLVELTGRLAARHGGKLTVQALQNANSRRYGTSAAARDDLERLVGLGLGRWEHDPAPARGGKAVTYFVPVAPVALAHENACTTHDDSDNRPADAGRPYPGAGAGPSDDRPDAPDDRPPSPTPVPARTDEPETSCVESGAAPGERLSESSCVVHERVRTCAGPPTPFPPPVGRRPATPVVGTAVDGSTPVPERVNVTDPAAGGVPDIDGRGQQPPDPVTAVTPDEADEYPFEELL